MTALAIQQRYCGAAERYLAQCGSTAEEEYVLRLWQDCLVDLEQDTPSRELGRRRDERVRMLGSTGRHDAALCGSVDSDYTTGRPRTRKADGMRPIPARRHHWAVVVLVGVVAANTALTYRQVNITDDQANMLAEVLKSDNPLLYPSDDVFSDSGDGAAWRLRLH